MKICSNCGRTIADDSIFCEYCGKRVVERQPAQPTSPTPPAQPAYREHSTPSYQPMLRERHGCITAWLWLALISCIVTIGRFLIGAYHSMNGIDDLPQAILLGDYDPDYLPEWIPVFLIGAAFLAFLMLIAVIQLMNWKRSGFNLYVTAAFLTFLLSAGLSLYYGDDYTMIAASLIGFFIGIFIFYGILHIRKNGVSYWSQLE